MAALSHARMAEIAEAMGAFKLAGPEGRPFDATGKTAWGEWHDPMYVQLRTDGMVLLFDMAFTGRDGVRRTIPATAFSNGADIPRYVQPVAGESMKGPYVRSAMGHDHWLLTLSDEEAHTLFYDAMRTDGCTEEQADWFYHAVVGYTWWTRMGPLRSFLRSSWRLARPILRRVLPLF